MHLAESTLFVISCASLGYCASLGPVEAALCGLLMISLAFIDAHTKRSLRAEASRWGASSRAYRESLDEANARIRSMSRALRDRLAEDRKAL